MYELISSRAKMVESKNCIYFSPSIVVHCVRDDVTVKSTIDAKFLEVKLCHLVLCMYLSYTRFAILKKKCFGDLQEPSDPPKCSIGDIIYKCVTCINACSVCFTKLTFYVIFHMFDLMHFKRFISLHVRLSLGKFTNTYPLLCCVWRSSFV